MECNFPTCSRHAQPNSWCIGHAIYAKGVVVKVKEEIPKKSDTQKEIDKELKKKYPVFLAKHHFRCGIDSPDCRKKATCIHHTKGRDRSIVLNEAFWVASCEPCNSWVEANHNAAEEMGLKFRRHQRRESIPFRVSCHNLPHLCGVTPVPDPVPEGEQVLVIEYSRSKAEIKKLLERVKDEPTKYFYISKTEYVRKGVPLEKVAPLFKPFMDQVNCSLPQEFLDVLVE